MFQTPYFIHALSFALGFWWVCYHKQIDRLEMIISVVGGCVLGLLALGSISLFDNISLQDHLAYFAIASLAGATLLLWFRSRESLVKQMGRNGVYTLTLTFIYFCTPWQGLYRVVGLALALPCLLILHLCWQKKSFEVGSRTVFMFWAMMLSLVIGVRQIWSSPDVLSPLHHLSVGGSGGWLHVLNTSLRAAGLVFLAFNLFPFVEWVRNAALGHKNSYGLQMLSNQRSEKQLLALTFFHGLPLLLNWQFHFFTYDFMLSYSLVWSPLLNSFIADTFLVDRSNRVIPS